MSNDPQIGHSPDSPPELGELERDIMELAWTQNERTVREIMRELNASSGRERAYTTVMTVMGNLRRKGLLRCRREGRTDFYAPVLGRDAYTRARARAGVDELLRRYGDVALAQFASEAAGLDDERRAQLRKLAGDE